MATLAVLLVTPACGSKSKPAADLVVASFSPTGTTDDASAPIKVQFDKPVVDEAQVGTPLNEPLVSLSPAVEVDAFWADRQTLVAKPKAPYAPSTRYEVKLAGSLAGRAGDKTFSFVHRPLAVEGLVGVDVDHLPPKPSLVLRFNQPVRGSDAAAHCTLAAKTGGKPVALAAADPALVDPAVTLSPQSDLAQGAELELRCEKLTGAGGNIAMAEAFTTTVHTYAALKVVATKPTGADVAPDELDIEITFSTPVDLEAVRRAVTSKPEIPGIGQGWLDDDGTRYKVSASLDTTTEYTVTLAAGVTDAFKQTLADATTFSFTTGNAQPRLSFDTGVYAVEAAGDGYPVWSRNVSKFAIECAVVPKARVVKVLAGGLDFNPYYDADTEQKLDWKGLGLRPRDKDVAIEQVKNKWNLTNVKLDEACGGATPRGLFLAEIGSTDLQADPDAPWRYRPHRRVLANVTDLGVMLKAGAGSSVIWVTSISTGKPVEGAAVTLFSPEGKQVFKGTTDADGLVRAPGTGTLVPKKAAKPASEDEEEGEEGEEEEEYSWSGPRLIGTVEKEGDMAVVDGSWTDGLQSWNFDVSSDWNNDAVRVRGFIQSDRGIYRPGETVHFKGLVREVAIGQAPRVPDLPAIKIRVTDPRGGEVFKTDAKMSSFGGFAFDLPLGSEAALGDYYVNASAGTQTFNERFQVEEFRKVTFEIKVGGGDREVKVGEALAFDVNADYLFGSPVARGKVKWTVERRPHWLSFPGYWEMSFADWAASSNYDWWERKDEGTQFVSDGDGATDGKGHYKFTLRDPDKDIQGPQDYMAQVTVTDETDQSVSKQVSVVAHKTDYYLGINAKEWVQKVGTPAAIELIALSPAGKPIAAKGTLTLIRQNWDCHYSEGYRGYWTCDPKHEEVLSREVSLAGNDKTIEQIDVEKPGEYVIRIAGVDGRGNAIAASTWLWVVGKGEASWMEDDQARMGLIASKPAYKPGDVARIVPKSSLAGAMALVTIERNGVIDAFVRPFESTGEAIDIPVTDAFAPNVYATVTMVRGRIGKGDKGRPRLQMGVAELKVSSDAQKLSVSVKADRDIYEPGQDVTGTIKVTGADGQPVAAEVALSAADEGVLQLIAYQTPNPMTAFYADWGLGVSSATSWTQIARLNDPSEGDEDEGGDGGGHEGPAVRSRFVSSAYWAPALMTDEKGEIRFGFKAPDNLTAFRLMAVAADAGARFGSGDSRMVVRKPLLAEPVLPRFFAPGDQAEIGVVVRNYTGAAGTAKVVAKVDGIRLSKTEQTVDVPADGSERVRFTGTVAFTRQADVEFDVTMGTYSDALKLELPVERAITYDRKTLGRGKLDGTIATIPLAWTEGDILPRDSTLAISVDRTGMSELEGSLKYLVEYPYGCLEQTLSKTVPMMKVADLADSLEMESLQGTRLKSYIRIGMAKVFRHQHPDGNFSLWPDSETYPYLTVYAMWGINEAVRSGVAVDKEGTARGLAAMKSWAADAKITPDGDGATLAQAAYVMANMKEADAGLNARLFEARRGLPRYGQAYLLMAMKLAGAPADQLATLETEILAALDDKGTTALMREGNLNLSWWMSSDVRTSAITLSALLMVDPSNPAIDKLAEGVKLEQRPGGYWNNTEENLYGLIALADYARRMAQGTATITISLDGKPLVNKRTVKGSQVVHVGRKLSKIKPGTLTIDAKGPVRYSVRLVTARKEVAKEPLDNGFVVKREYLDYATGRPIKEAKATQLIKVKLTVSSKEPRNYVAVVDPMPGGFESVNQKLATSLKTHDDDVDDDDSEDEDYEESEWAFAELRDEKVMVFSDRLEAGEHTYEYLVRATLPGKFTAAAAHAEAMYDPDVYGRTAAQEVTVKR